MDIRRLLAVPAVYALFRNLVSTPAGKGLLSREWICPQPGMRILDIGCGPGTILEDLPDVEYVGFDADEKYIESARRRYGHRGQFHCRPVDRKLIQDLNLREFDRVLAIGVLHHIPDEGARHLFDVANAALKPGGRLVTYDPCFAEGQSAVSRILVSLDRGEFVRDAEQFVALAHETFPKVKHQVYFDLLRMPYAIQLMSCQKSAVT